VNWHERGLPSGGKRSLLTRFENLVLTCRERRKLLMGPTRGTEKGEAPVRSPLDIGDTRREQSLGGDGQSLRAKRWDPRRSRPRSGGSQRKKEEKRGSIDGGGKKSTVLR